MIHSKLARQFFREKIRGGLLWLRDLASPCEVCRTRLRERQLWVDPERRSGNYAFVWSCRPCHEAIRATVAELRAARLAG